MIEQARLVPDDWRRAGSVVAIIGLGKSGVAAARFGADATSSVLDLDCRAHELDNLYVVDSSFFVTIGAVNPTLTIAANALRVGEHLLGRLG